VALISIVWSWKLPATPEMGVNATAGNPVSIVTTALRENLIEAYPLWSVFTAPPPILRGREGTGVASMRTCTVTEATEGVGEGEPSGGAAGVGELVGDTGVVSGVGVTVEAFVGVGVKVDVIVGVGVRVNVEVGVG